LKIKLNIKREKTMPKHELLEMRADKIIRLLKRRFPYYVDKAGDTKRMQLSTEMQKAVLHYGGHKKFPMTPQHKKNLRRVGNLYNSRDWYRNVSKNPIKRLLDDIAEAKIWTPRKAKGFEYVQVEKELKFTKGGLQFFNKHKVLFVNRLGVAVKPLEKQVLAAYEVKNRKPRLVLDFTQMSLGTIRILINDLRSTHMRDASRLFITKRYRTIVDNTGYVEGKTIRECLSYIDFSRLTKTKVVVSWFAFFNQKDGESVRVSNAYTLDPEDIKVQMRVKGEFPISFREGVDVNDNQFIRFMGAIRRKVEKDLIKALLDKGYSFTSLVTLERFIERDATLGFESPVLDVRVAKIERGEVREFGLKGFRFGIKFQPISTGVKKKVRKNSVEWRIKNELFREWEYEGVRYTRREFDKELEKRVRNAKKGGKYGKAEKDGDAFVSTVPVVAKISEVRDNKVSRQHSKPKRGVSPKRVSKQRKTVSVKRRHH
jgi:hypothetical protein